MPGLIDSYMDWSYHQDRGDAREASGEDGDAEGSVKVHSLRIADMYSMF